MFWAAVAYALSGRAANGLAVRFHLGLVEDLLSGVFLLFLVVVGFQAVDWVAARGGDVRTVLPLPRRSTEAREWGVGAAVGWGAVLLGVLPLAVTANLHGQLRGWTPFPAVLGLLSVLVVTLAQEVVFRGYALRRLAEALGSTRAAILSSVVFAIALLWPATPAHPFWPLVNEVLLGLLLALAWFRTRGLWLGWGLHFAYRAVTAVVLGLPAAGRNLPSLAVDGYATGPRLLSGGGWGPDGALWTMLVLLGAGGVLYGVSRDWAWHYTFPEIVPGGYAMDAPPPPEHEAMQRSFAPPPPAPALVHILPAAAPPPPPSTEPRG